MTTLNPVAECRSCRHSYPDATNALRCRLFKTYADLPCARFEREPGSDDANKVWVAGGWHVAGEGRGD
ncbi:MAG: hypothetical protein WA085_13300 [Sphingobium sp.]